MIKSMMITIVLLQVILMAQSKVGELTITKDMKLAGFNLFPDSNMSYSSFLGTNYAYFDTVARVINIYSLPSLTLSKTIAVPAVVKNADNVTITKTWFNLDNQFELIYSGYEISGSVVNYHCTIFSESGSQIFSANGQCGLLYQPGGAYISISDQSLITIYKLRDIVVAINSLQNRSKEIYITQQSDELVIEIPNSSKTNQDFVLLTLNGKQISSSKYLESNKNYIIQLNHYHGVAVLASREANGELQSRTVIIQ